MSQPDYACNPYALYEYVKNNTEHETAWLIKKDERYYELLKRGIRCAVYNTMEGDALLDEADYVITNSYTFQRLPKRQNQIFVNLWHGSGIKAHDFYNHDMNPEHAKNLLDFFSKIDMMCVHSLDDRFKLCAQLHYDLRKCYITGQPRLDCVKKSKGYDKIEKLFGVKMREYSRYIFFAPSFRANSSSHSGNIFSENIFRLDDYDKDALNDFLKKNNAALIYKLHPIEQTAFSGRNFSLSENCFELTDQMLFENDIRYDDLLNVFDTMISDYSSIVYDYLLLNRPIVYLIPDYEEYTSERGFVFHNIDMFMPGEKAFNFNDMISALDEAFTNPQKYKKERELVLAHRFDYSDDQSARRCYEEIMNYKAIPEPEKKKAEKWELKSPSTATLIEKWIPEQYEIIDSTKAIPDRCQLEAIKKKKTQKYLYITEEIPRELRKLAGRSSAEIEDIAFYHDVKKCENVKICKVTGGVDYDMFSASQDIVSDTKKRPRIGFAGTIDNRIYFAMVQCICEVFSDYDIIFAGEIFDKFPVWLHGFDNLHYVPATYEELPSIIKSFDVAILPFFGRHANTIPKEYFQYLATGKQVVASNMTNLPDTAALYRSASVDDAVRNIREALTHIEDINIQESAKALAKQYDWKEISRNLVEGLIE